MLDKDRIRAIEVIAECRIRGAKLAARRLGMAKDEVAAIRRKYQRDKAVMDAVELEVEWADRHSSAEYITSIVELRQELTELIRERASEADFRDLVAAKKHLSEVIWAEKLYGELGPGATVDIQPSAAVSPIALPRPAARRGEPDDT